MCLVFQAVLGLSVVVSGSACEYGITANVGISRESDGRLVANVFACASNDRLSLSLLINHDDIGDTGDETVLWELSGRTPDAGLLAMKVGGICPRVPCRGASSRGSQPDDEIQSRPDLGTSRHGD